jgi:hypothetical protein
MKMNDCQEMSIEEFVKSGGLQEVNRQWFHPRGLALVVEIDDHDGEYYLWGIKDARSDPEGWAVGDGYFTKEKTVESERWRRDHAQNRIDALGYEIQPVEGI